MDDALMKTCGIFLTGFNCFFNFHILYGLIFNGLDYTIDNFFHNTMVTIVLVFAYTASYLGVYILIMYAIENRNLNK